MCGDLMNLYNRIEALCSQKGINVTQMCKEARVSRGSMGDLANGRISSLSAKALMKISEYFNASMDYLTGKREFLVDGTATQLMKKRGEIMTISEKIEAVSEVLSILAQKKCTVDEASLILSEAQKEIRSTATVQDLDYKTLLTKAYRHLL